MKDHDDNKETFQYTYSASQQKEVRNIRNKYTQKEESKMERLRRLDRSVNEKATAVSLCTGILGTLLLGLGMSCAMVWQGTWFVPGILIGAIGISILSAAYPLYLRTIKKERKRIAPEILRLTDELMK